MKTTIFPHVFILLLLCLTTNAQQALWGGSAITSPEIHPDNSVTFRLLAPNAKKVLLTGDWIDPRNPLPMISLNDSIWSYTTPPLESNLYNYSFIVDDIRINDPSNIHLFRDVATLTNIFIIDGGQGNLYKVNSVPHGSVTHRWYYSPGNQMYRRVTIYTPPGYEKSTDLYPVLYLLHGMGGDEEAWITLGRTAQIMDNLIAKQMAKPMIVVMPNGNVSQEAAPGESSLGLIKPTIMLPRTMDGKMEETFMDVVQFIEDNYRVPSNKSARAIAGLSMGGFHSLHISRYYPNTFDFVGLFSPAIFPRNSDTSRVYSNFEATLKTQMENGFKLYWIAIGKTDFLFDQVVMYRSHLDKINMPYIYRESDGGHTWNNWRIYLSEFATMLFK